MLGAEAVCATRAVRDMDAPLVLYQRSVLVASEGPSLPGWGVGALYILPCTLLFSMLGFSVCFLPRLGHKHQLDASWVLSPSGI